MPQYVDGFLIPIKKKDLKKYKNVAEIGKKIWMKCGALNYYECSGDLLDVPYGKPFTKLCKIKSNETLILAFVIYKSKIDRERVNKRVAKAYEGLDDNSKGLYELKRFTAGTFNVLVKA